MAGLSALAAVAPAASVRRPIFNALEKFGRNSLFVYWIHVELVYGYATWIVHRRLPLGVALAAYVAFCALMYVAIGMRDRVVAYWRSTRSTKPSPLPMAPAQL